MSWYSDIVIPALGNRHNVQIPGRTYNDPVPFPGGYTAEHKQFNDKNDYWSNMASSPHMRNLQKVRGVIAVKVQMGTLKSGQRNIQMIGVSTYQAIK